MLYSLCRKTQEKVTVYLLNQTLSNDEIDEFDDFLKNKCNSKLIVCNISGEIFNSLPTGSLPKETYSRIIAQFVLPENLDRILWLDGDIILLKNISEFYHQDFNDKYYVVCPDIVDIFDDWHKDCVNNIRKNMNIDEGHIYFNAGVMLMNLKKLRKDTNFSDLINLAYKNKDNVMFADQDVLNYIYQNEVKYDDWKKYNCQRVELKGCIDYNDVIVLHYNGIRKPWDYKFLDKLSKYYWKEYVLLGNFAAFVEMVWFYIRGALFKTVEQIIKMTSNTLYTKIKKLIWKR